MQNLEQTETEYQQVEFNGLPGPTHNYAGLSPGNIASSDHQGSTSNPREAFLQCLEKARYIQGQGAVSAVLPPNSRPNLKFLRDLGFTGSDEEVITQAAEQAPKQFKQAMSSASMWVANAATIAPSLDTQDETLRILPANLAYNLHRQLEGTDTTAILRAVFREGIQQGIIEVLDPLPNHESLGDEGAANHMRFTPDFNSEGLHTFVYGKSATTKDQLEFPARQTLEASQAAARRLKLRTDLVRFYQQNPAAINAGVFHNDVIANNNLWFFMLDKLAFANPEQVIGDVRGFLKGKLHTVMSTARDMYAKEVVDSYVFNSQIINTPTGMVLIAPTQARDNVWVKRFLDLKILADGSPIVRIEYLDTTQSMKNGGGPACLRLRIVMSPDELEATSSSTKIFLDDATYQSLREIGQTHYRDELKPDDLRDPNLITEAQTALDRITQTLQLGSIYDFQKV